MDPISLIFVLVGGAVVLLIGELLLPTHGVLGFAGLLCLAGAIGVCFYLNRWLGLGVLLAAVIASPFVWNFLITVWMKTPVGKRIVLAPYESRVAPPAVRAGDTGITVSELRPMGEVEFDGRRFEAIAEHGMIPPGSRVRVVALRQGMPAVRVIPSEPAT
jgi:membrane-bound ClpP family serine protease